MERFHAINLGMRTVQSVSLGLLLLVCVAERSRSQETQDGIFMKLTESPKYNKRLRPHYNMGKPEDINASVLMYSMASVDDLHTEYNVQILFRQTWKDIRLKFQQSLLPEETVIHGDHWHAERLWLPNVHVLNDAEADSLSRMLPASTSVMIFPDGTVMLSKRAQLRLKCDMEFYKFPLDKQTCTLKIESSSHTYRHLRLHWEEDDPMSFSSSFSIKGFQLLNYNHSETVSYYNKSGNFSKILAKFHLKREFGPFLLDIYLPCITFVITSWTSFWMDIPAAPARVTISMTTMLTLVTGGKTIREKLPKVPYVHALDVWFLGCTAFVFASLIEYALVNYIYNKDKRRRQGGIRRVDSTASLASMGSRNSSFFNIMNALENSQNASPHKYRKNSRMTPIFKISDLEAGQITPTPSVGQNSQASSNIDPMSCVWITPLTPQDIANGIDRKCRLIFPVAFAIFNAVYWSVLSV